MSAKKRNRRVFSIKSELILKAREAMMAAVQIYNNPLITFKSEIFIVNAIISWTYLLHAFYRERSIDYRFYDLVGASERKKFHKTKHGRQKYWDLETCIERRDCTLEKGIKLNLKYLISIRHEIEHQMTLQIDDTLSAKFQACCLNFNKTISTWFGEEFALHKELSFALQFSGVSQEQDKITRQYQNLPKNIKSLNTTFEAAMSDQEYNDPAFSYRVAFVEKIANHKGQADTVYEFVGGDTREGKEINKVLIKEIKQELVGAKKIVELIQAKGYRNFTLADHTAFWKSIDAQSEDKKLGQKAGQWWWYKDVWFKKCLEHCKANEAAYK